MGRSDAYHLPPTCHISINNRLSISVFVTHNGVGLTLSQRHPLPATIHIIILWSSHQKLTPPWCQIRQWLERWNRSEVRHWPLIVPSYQNSTKICNLTISTVLKWRIPLLYKETSLHFLHFKKSLPASRSMSCNCSADFIARNFWGTSVQTLIMESVNPTANRLESSDTSALVTLLTAGII